MAQMIGSIKHALTGIRTVGLASALQAAVYPFRRSYHEARFASDDNSGSVLRGLGGLITALRPKGDQKVDPRDFLRLGNVLSHSHEGQTVTFRCQNASLQVSILATDLVRIRSSDSGVFRPLQSYAIAKADHKWTRTPFVLQETAKAVEIRTARMTCQVIKQPCRLVFADANGQHIHADAEALGWQGDRVAHFSRLEPEEHI